VKTSKLKLISAHFQHVRGLIGLEVSVSTDVRHAPGVFSA